MRRILVLSLMAASLSAHAREPANSRVVELSEGERAHLKQEMRALLTGTQAILDALARRDMRGVTRHAGKLGSSMTRQVERGNFCNRLPVDFLLTGQSVHQGFDRIARDARAIGRPSHTLNQLAATLNHCVRCHATYRVSVRREIAPTQP